MKVYRYGLLPPTISAKLVDDQIWLAHKYQNKLVEIERERRDDVDRVLDAAGLLSHREAVTNANSDIDKALKIQKKKDREESLGVLRPVAKEAWESFKKKRSELLKSVSVKPEVEFCNAQAKKKHIEARKACGVHWGSYLVVEQAMDAARSGPEPHFRRFTGDGTVAVQLQGGLDTEGILASEDSRVRLYSTPLPVPGRKGKPIPRLWLRIGSDGRAPVWAQWPIVYHRPLPVDGVVKWVKVTRRRIATVYKWEAHFVVDEPSLGLSTSDTIRGCCYVNLGWARVDKDLRVSFPA